MQIIPANKNKKSFETSFVENLTQSLPSAIDSLITSHKGKKAKEAERTLETDRMRKQAKALGISEDITDPKVIAELVSRSGKDQALTTIMKDLGLNKEPISPSSQPGDRANLLGDSGQTAEKSEGVKSLLSTTGEPITQNKPRTYKDFTDNELTKLMLFPQTRPLAEMEFKERAVEKQNKLDEERLGNKNTREDKQLKDRIKREQDQYELEHGHRITSAEKLAVAKKATEDFNAETSAGNRKQDVLNKTEREKKEDITKSYDKQKEFIDKTTNSYKSYETDFKPRLMAIQSIPDDQLISSTASAFLDKFNIPLGVLDKPGSELFSKLSQDLLKGLPESYGNRILKAEVESFLLTIPQLSQSADGRRLIGSTLLKLGEMKEIYYNKMRDSQKTIVANKEEYPSDFEQSIFDEALPQIQKVQDEFIKVSQIRPSAIPKGMKPYFTPDSRVIYVPNTPEEAKKMAENGAKKIW